MAKDGGPAFPGYTMHDDGETVSVTKLNPGMTLRDYFAGQALAGFCANSLQEAYQAPPARVAEWSYTWADAMLAARESQNVPS